MESFYNQKISQKPLDFSFYQENNNQKTFIERSSMIPNNCKTKYEFLKSLIEKYEQKPKKRPKEDFESKPKLKEQSSSKKVESNKKPLLSPKLHLQKEHKKDDKSANFSNSQIKAKLQEAEKSHQEICDKFKSPLPNNSKPNHKIEEKEMKSQNLDRKDVIHEVQQKDKSAISTQNSSSSGSIPLIESVLMSNQNSARSLIQPQMEPSPVRELSEFQIPEREMRIEEQKKEEIKLEEREKMIEKKQDTQEVEQKENKGLTILYIAVLIMLIIIQFI